LVATERRDSNREKVNELTSNFQLPQQPHPCPHAAIHPEEEEEEEEREEGIETEEEIEETIVEEEEAGVVEEEGRKEEEEVEVARPRTRCEECPTSTPVPLPSSQPSRLSSPEVQLLRRRDPRSNRAGQEEKEGGLLFLELDVRRARRGRSRSLKS